MQFRPGTMVLAALLVLRAGAALAEDSDQRRYYVGLRFETLAGVTRANDVAGATLGLNLNRYLGAELAIDSYEVKVGQVAELSVLGLTPQVRLRYPLLEDRLVPYLVGGFGMAVTQGNDARTEVEWDGGKDGIEWAATAGGGLDYFIADNLSIGFEAKELFSGSQGYETGGRQGAVAISAPVITFSIRLFYPQLHPEENEAAARAAFARFYIDLRTGGALLVNREPFDGVSAVPEHSVLDSNFAQQYGVSVGVNLGRYASVEIALDNYELKLSTADLGGIGEYAVFPVVVQSRLRYPLLDDRLQPYAIGGVGGEFAEINDRGAVGKSIVVTAKDVTVIGALGAGVEYFVMSNVALGLEARYVISRGHEFTLEDQPTQRGNFDSFLLSLGVRIFFANI